MGLRPFVHTIYCGDRYRTIRERFSAVAPFLEERGCRLVAAAEAFAAGYGGRDHRRQGDPGQGWPAGRYGDSLPDRSTAHQFVRVQQNRFRDLARNMHKGWRM
jgi:hypothetical protein